MIVLRQRVTCPCPRLDEYNDEGNHQFFMYGKDEAIVEQDDGSL